MFKGIILNDGTPLSEHNVQPTILGYRIVHQLTSRILPGTTRNEVYSKPAAIKKMNQIASMYTIQHAQLDIWDYDLEEIYDFECPMNPKFITDSDDHLFI